MLLALRVAAAAAHRSISVNESLLMLLVLLFAALDFFTKQIGL